MVDFGCWSSRPPIRRFVRSDGRSRHQGGAGEAAEGDRGREESEAEEGHGSVHEA